MDDKQIIKLFKSGKFTVIYWDNDAPYIYKGHWDKDEEFDRDEYKTMNKKEFKFNDYGNNGYCPKIVELLVKALGGKSDSI